MYATLKQLVSQRTKHDDVLHAQIEAFTKQIPLLYVILCMNAWALAVTHFSVAPAWLTIHIPAALTLVCLIRLYVWRMTRHQALSSAQIVKRIHTTTVLGVLIGVSFMIWGIALSRHYQMIQDPGAINSNGHVAFFIGITVISCIFLLMHAAAAALSITATIVLPFVVYLVARGDLIGTAIGINLLLVAAAMVYILVISYHSFEKMVLAQSELRKLNAENARLANIDSLTQLPNRRQFFQELGALTQDDRPGHLYFAVGVMDLDGFKQVNDIYGHAIGDRLLVACGDRISQIAGDNVFVSRLGGDEFGIIVRAQALEDDIVAIGHLLCEAIKAPYALPGATVSVGASVGFSILHSTARGGESHYEQADYALYHAKQHHRGQVVVFSETHQSEIKTIATIEQALRQCDLDTELSLRFQPIFHADKHKIVAFEALARWHNPVLGMVSPAVFIPVAERTDIIHQITRILLAKALEALKSWPEPMEISFNLSIRDVMSPEQILAIITLVRNSGINPRRLNFEVTETSLMDEFERAEDAIAALKALGCTIALDDFGTGYSSLSYIHHLPLDKIKIDRSFMRDIETNATSRDIVRSILGLCKTLSLRCVVEGIETEEQMLLLRSLGCELMQGYYFGHPMPFAETGDVIARAA